MPGSCLKKHRLSQHGSLARTTTAGGKGAGHRGSTSGPAPLARTARALGSPRPGSPRAPGTERGPPRFAGEEAELGAWTPRLRLAGHPPAHLQPASRSPDSTSRRSRAQRRASRGISAGRAQSPGRRVRNKEPLLGRRRGRARAAGARGAGSPPGKRRPPELGQIPPRSAPGPAARPLSLAGALGGRGRGAGRKQPMGRNRENARKSGCCAELEIRLPRRPGRGR